MLYRKYRDKVVLSTMNITTTQLNNEDTQVI